MALPKWLREELETRSTHGRTVRSETLEEFEARIRRETGTEWDPATQTWRPIED